MYFESSAAFPDLKADEMPAGILVSSCVIEVRETIENIAIVIENINFI
jgi:hypothetical protein